MNRVYLPLAIAAGLMCPSVGLEGQVDERALDRLLVAEGVTDVPGVPLEEDGRRLFPDRDLEIGPGYWRLIREDGASTHDLTDALGDAGRAFAHAYIKAPHDLTVGLALAVPECLTASVYVNGQAAAPGAVIPMRLAGGWNTVLMGFDGAGAGCRLELQAALTYAAAPDREDDDPLDLSALVIQASRPPGARPNYPDGSIVPSDPVPTGLSWSGTDNRLVADLEVSVTSWGRPRGLASPGGPDRPTGPPTVDLTGDWTITLYAPTGIIETHAALTMDEAGLLEGRMEGERLEGDIRDGWVSGDQFGWSIRASGGRGGFEIRLQGALTDDVMSGTMDFGGFRDFQARFEGERGTGEEEDGEGGEGSGGDEETGEEGDAGGESEEDRAGERPTDARGPGGFPADPSADLPMIPAPGDPDPSEPVEDELAAPADPDGLRARIMRSLLPPPEDPPEPAPVEASLELKAGGGQVTGGAVDLVPLRPAVLGGSVQFGQARSAALDPRAVETRVWWNDDDHDFVGGMSADALLRAFHGPIRLVGWGLEGSEGFTGTFRVPDALAGFTIGVGDGTWTVNGAPIDGLLCSPCTRGQQLEVSVAGTSEPVVRIDDPGYVESGDPDSAERWLEALRGDNARYREMGRTGGGF